MTVVIAHQLYSYLEDKTETKLTCYHTKNLMNIIATKWCLTVDWETWSSTLYFTIEKWILADLIIRSIRKDLKIIINLRNIIPVIWKYESLGIILGLGRKRHV